MYICNIQSVEFFSFGFTLYPLDNTLGRFNWTRLAVLGAFIFRARNDATLLSRRTGPAEFNVVKEVG